ncbi:MAG TPA: cytochrome c [Steroidobacteraceae bacterium]|jgi:mono/diheme cytochrome c family protein|nr:cytochrome c [Steroidobacteraceae bacterium]
MSLRSLAYLAAALSLGASVCAFGADEAARGHTVFEQWCVACHGEGPGHPGTGALAVKYHGTKPALLEQRTDLTPAIIKFYVRNGYSIMTPFRKTEITDAQLDALAAYLSNAGRAAGRGGAARAAAKGQGSG